MENNVFSVSEINGHIKDILDSDPILGNVAVRGELSNYKVYPSGHHYFTMKDAEGALRCVLFKGSAMKLRFKPENGMKVIAAGRIAVFPRDGAYQLYATGLIPDGIGDLHAAFEQLKTKLGAEGLFDPQYKKPIPRMPQRIAVITSSAGAAVRDIIRVLGKRWPMSKVILLPVRVQGEEAPAEIAGAIRYANRHEIADVIITGRGGGSIEDLWAFNDERVAREIFRSVIPVISAVGHEPDVTISDYVADLRAATPSNAAELAVPEQEEMRALLSSAEARIYAAVKKKLELCSGKIRDISGRRVMQSPRYYIDDRRVLLDHVRTRLISAGERTVMQKKRGYAERAAKLDALSPLKVLGRGYLVAERDDGAVVRSVDDVSRGDTLGILLADGKLSCTVDGKEKYDG